MNRDLLLAAARDLVVQMIADGYSPPAGRTVTSTSALDLSGLAAGGTDYDRQVLVGLSQVLGGDETRADSKNMATERQVLFDLIARPETRARMEHMLGTGKPLRN